MNIDDIIFTHGEHRDSGLDGPCCVLEACNVIKQGLKTDDPLPGIPESLIMVAINDWAGWQSDQERTDFLRPYAKAFLAMEPDAARSQRRAYALADYAVRVIVPEAFDTAASSHPDATHAQTMRDHAAKLRALDTIRDGNAARAAAAAAHAAAHAAADAAPAADAAADAAARATRAAAGAATRAAAGAAARAAAADYAAAREVFLRHARNLLDIATGD